MALTSERDTAAMAAHQAPPAQPAIRVTIGELVLNGFPAAQRRQIGDAVQAELTRLISERGLPAGSGELSNNDRLDGGAFRVPGLNASATLVGRRIAAAVYHSLAGSEG